MGFKLSVCRGFRIGLGEGSNFSMHSTVTVFRLHLPASSLAKRLSSMLEC